MITEDYIGEPFLDGSPPLVRREAGWSAYFDRNGIAIYIWGDSKWELEFSCPNIHLARLILENLKPDLAGFRRTN